MKPAITTISLIVANVLVLGYILLIDRHRLDSDTAEARKSHLIHIDPEAVARVKIRTAEGEADVVQQADGSWRFTAPFEDRFSPRLMKELLEEGAAQLRINQTIGAKEIKKNGWDDEYFGFGEGAIGVEFMDRDGKSLGAVELGGATPYERTIYARLASDSPEDEPVQLVWGYLRDVVTQPFSELRDRRLIYAKANDVFRVKFRPPSATNLEVHVERGPDMRWRMEKPLKARCDQDLVGEFIAKLAKLELHDFVDEPGADMEAAFDKDKRYEIAFRRRPPGSENSLITTVEFGRLPEDDKDPFVLARVSDRSGLFLVDKRVHFTFGMDANTLRSRTLADFEYDAVSGVRIKRLGKEEVVLKRWGNAWALHRDPDKPDRFDPANGRMVKDLHPEDQQRGDSEIRGGCRSRSGAVRAERSAARGDRDTPVPRSEGGRQAGRTPDAAGGEGHAHHGCRLRQPAGRGSVRRV